MGRRLPHSALIYALALLQLVAVPVASVLDAKTAAAAAPSIPHVEGYAAEHASLAHAHDCAVCSFVRAAFAPQPHGSVDGARDVRRAGASSDAPIPELLRGRITLARAPPVRAT